MMIISCRPSSTGCLQRELLEIKSKLLCFSFPSNSPHISTIHHPSNIHPIQFSPCPPPPIHHSHNLSVLPTHCRLMQRTCQGNNPFPLLSFFFIPPLSHPYVLFFLVQAFKSWRHSHGPPGQLFLLQTSTLELI